jgi:hypothetical protein
VAAALSARVSELEDERALLVGFFGIAEQFMQEVHFQNIILSCRFKAFTKLDRLARSVADLMAILQALEA